MKRIIAICLLMAVRSVVGLPSVDIPQSISAAIVIELTEDIIITQKGSPFIATKTFGAKGPEKLVITSKKGHAVIISEGSIWDLSSFSDKNKIIEFAGNARLVVQPGATLQGNGGVLRFTDTAQWICKGVV